MEVLRKLAKNGRVYRIVKDYAGLTPLFSIEFLREYEDDFRAWFPAYEPKNKIYPSLQDCLEDFKKFIAA